MLSKDSGGFYRFKDIMKDFTFLLYIQAIDWKRILLHLYWIIECQICIWSAYFKHIFTVCSRSLMHFSKTKGRTLKTIECYC